MKKKYFLSMLSILMLSMLCVGFTSCGDDDGENNSKTEGQNEEPASPESMENIVKSYVHATVDYSDYTWHIKITSSLGNQNANKSFKYGIEYGYGDYKYRKYASGNGSVYNMEEPLFFGSPFANEATFYRSYKALQEKQKTGTLSGSERELWYEVVDALSDAEYEASAQYMGRVFCEVDGQRYYITNY